MSRIPPLSPEKFSQEQKAVAEGMQQYNFARVMVHHPDLYRSYTPFAHKLMADSVLALRHREVLILRTLRLCDESYDASHHRSIARRVGMTEGEIDAASAGEGKRLSPSEQNLVKAAEELVSCQYVTDDTWWLLTQHYSRQQLMEIVFLVGNYTLMAMVTKSFDILVEAEFKDG